MFDVFRPDHPKCYSLTHPQKRIWYTEKIYPDTSLYNIAGSVRINGPVDFNLLEKAIRLQIARHDTLRIRVVEIDGEPRQYVDESDAEAPDFIDFSIYDDPEREFRQWLEREAQTPFVLERERLCRFPMFKISDQDNGFLVKFHHIVSDGWSSNLVIDQIYDCYMTLLNGQPAELEPAPAYLEYARQEERYIQSERFQKNRRFWLDKFSVLPDILTNHGYGSTAGKRKTYELDPVRSLQIKELAASAKCSVNTIFIFLYMLYMNKTAGQTDLVIGVPVFNRSGQKEKRTAGMFTSTMPFRYTFDDSSPVLEALVRIHQQLTECYYNQKYPYDLLVQDLELNKRGGDGLFGTCVNYYNTKVATSWDGSPAKVEELYNGNQLYALQLVVKDWAESGALLLEIDYKLQAYTERQIEDLYDRLNILVEQIICNPGERIARLSLLSEAEKSKQIAEFNDTGAEYPRGKTIHRLFEEQAARTPERIAIRHEREELTYRELNVKANQLARRLSARGVGRETVVGLLTRHSIETVIGILGILKAGGAYLPIDAAYPDGRIAYMLENSGCSLLLANMDIRERALMKGEVIDLNDPGLYRGDSSDPEAESGPGDLVYVIYTSGSTGTPKGVMIEHRGLVNYIWWAKNMYVKQEIEIFPLYSSLAFDLTVTSIFTPLISGGCIMVYGDDGDEYVLFRIMKENKATVVKLTPAHLSLLRELNHQDSSVKRFIIGGEDLRTSLARQIEESFGGRIELYNEYGPTETVVGCMIHAFDRDRDHNVSVPIGVPADNVQIYILDSNLNPVPVHVIGELYISGDGMARGYMNREDLTRDKFIPNPFATGRKMYRTGDLARFLEGGKIEYAGRVDHQVKIRGYRIELGEIERYLCEHDAIREAVVIDRRHEDGSPYLCAYVVGQNGASSAEWRTYLADRLPAYMVPAHFIVMNEIPLNKNGKVNRDMLPEPEKRQQTGLAADIFRDEAEAGLVGILRDVLQAGDIGFADNFYHLGGDSIKAIQVASRMKSGGYGIKVADILANPVIGDMVRRVSKSAAADMADQRRCEGGIRPTPIGSWFFAQQFADRHYYNQSLLLNLKQPIDASDLERLMDDLIEHHDALRIHVSADTEALFYNSRAEKCRVEVFHLADYGYEEQKLQMRLLGQSLKASMDIHRGALLKACLFDLGTNGTRLLLTAHHLIVDAVSWTILLEDLVSLHRQFVMKQTETLPWKTASVQSWAEYLWNHAEIIENERAYWESVLEAETAVRVDFALGEDTVASSETVIEHLAEEETGRLLGQANAAYGTDAKDLLVSALGAAIFDVFQMDEVVIELEGHGREPFAEPLDLSRTVGWFTSLYPVKLFQVSAELMPDRIKRTKEHLRKIPRKGVGFGVLARLTESIQDNGGQKRIRFNYLGDFDATFDNDLFSIADEPSGVECSMDNRLTSLLDMNVMVVNRKLHVSVTYSRHLFKAETVNGFVQTYASHLQALIRHCCEKNEVEFTPSDFETIALSQESLEGLYF